jgi:hypothetical protein
MKEKQNISLVAIQGRKKNTWGMGIVSELAKHRILREIAQMPERSITFTIPECLICRESP